MRQNIEHFIDEVSAFDVDWSGQLDDGEQIAESAWTLDHDSNKRLVLTASHTKITASVQVRGGMARCQHLLTNIAITSKGRTLKAEYWLNTRQGAAAAPPGDPPETPTAVKARKKKDVNT